MQRDGQMETVLSARVHLYRWFQAVLGVEPFSENLDWIFDEASFETLGLFVDEENEGVASLLEKVKQVAQRYRENPDEVLDRMKDDYTAIFIGPGRLPFYHWESVYVQKEPVLFQKVTLEVRNAYRNAGFLPQEYPHVADDHVALELDFMMRLSMRIQEAYGTGNERQLQEALAASKGFLCRHLLRWTKSYASCAAKTGERYCLYPHAVQLLEGVLESDREALSQIEKIFGL